MEKEDIIRVLEEIASLLELQNENPFKIRAYRNAARALLSMEDFKLAVEKGKLTDYEGIGDHIAEKITELYRTGRLAYYTKLVKSTPKPLLKMLQVHGLGPKKVQILYKKLHIKSIPALKKAAKEGKLSKLKGFGSKTKQNILKALENSQTWQQRHLWWDAIKMAEMVLQRLKKIKEVKEAEIAGSLRRKLETIGDLDFVVASTQPQSVMKAFVKDPSIKRILNQGETKASVILKEGFQADLRIVPPDQFGFALLYFTGSKEHNIKLRERSLKKGWSLSEYGFEGKKAPKGNLSEKEIFASLGLDFIPPELRENQGEITAAEKHKLPHLIELSDIRGAFHVHTTESDGRNTIKEMVAAAKELGWEYLGISDHSKAAFQANGLTEERLLKQVEEIRAFNSSKKEKFHLFAGVECDILTNGSLDLSNNILKQLDFVIASVHTSLQQDEKSITRRIIRAIEHPYTTMLGHVTGRLLLSREGSKANLTKVIDACIANKKIMELNSQPQRLDMDWRFWHAAAARGLLCCINPDAHSKDQLRFVEAGIHIARKGWLEKEQVINTLPLKGISELFVYKH